MRPHLVITAIVFACVAVIWLLVGVDSESGGEETMATTEESAPPPETADPLPELPRGWRMTVNASGGYALGVPPGWSVKEAGAKTTLRSPGSAAVVSVTADRSDEALGAPLDSYASEIVAGLAEVGGARPMESPPKPARGYEAAGVDAGGLGRVAVVVVRRPGLAAYPILIASGTGVRPAALRPIVNRLIGSLRGRPVAFVG